MNINKLSQVLQPVKPDIGLEKMAKGQGAPEGSNFESFVSESIKDVNNQLLGADQMVTEHLTTGKHDMHEVLIAIEKADLSFRYLNQVKNKVIDAYQEIMRTQV